MDTVVTYSFDLESHLHQDSNLKTLKEVKLSTFGELIKLAENGDNLLIAIVNINDTEQNGWNLCRDIYEDINLNVPVLVVVDAKTGDLKPNSKLLQNAEYFDDFISGKSTGVEVEIRINKILKKFGKQISKTIISYGPIVINTDTYQVLCDNRPLDLAYMEYELLKFLVSKPGKVYSRQSLLSRVWGYEYYGGARTVDVHVRRLRAKLGQEHENLVQTVRSVGYRFGLSKY